MSRRTSFFANSNDVFRVFQDVEATLPLSYYQIGLFDEKPSIHWTSIVDIPGLGIAEHGEPIRERKFLVLPQTVALTFREVPLKSGRFRYAVDQGENPGSAVLVAGGVYQDICIIIGEVTTVTDGQESVYDSIRNAIRSSFAKYGNTYVGAEALRLGKSGVRLALSARANRDSDLTL